MTIDEVLSKLKSVRARGPGRWSALCPAHADKSPSLSIALSQNDVILVHCFAGCAIDSICAACGLEIKDLFGPGQQEPIKRLPLRRTATVSHHRDYPSRLYAHATRLFLRGDSILQAARGLDCSNWSDDETGVAMEAVAQAYDDLARAELLFGVVVTLRSRELLKRQS